MRSGGNWIRICPMQGFNIWGTEPPHSETKIFKLLLVSIKCILLIWWGTNWILLLRIGASGGILWTRKWTFRFHKIWGISDWENISFSRRTMLHGVGQLKSNLPSFICQLALLDWQTKVWSCSYLETCKHVVQAENWFLYICEKQKQFENNQIQQQH